LICKIQTFALLHSNVCFGQLKRLFYTFQTFQLKTLKIKSVALLKEHARVGLSGYIYHNSSKLKCKGKTAFGFMLVGKFSGFGVFCFEMVIKLE
jgi:hypothetical protein